MPCSILLRSNGSRRPSLLITSGIDSSMRSYVVKRRLQPSHSRRRRISLTILRDARLDDLVLVDARRTGSASGLLPGCLSAVDQVDAALVAPADERASSETCAAPDSATPAPITRAPSAITFASLCARAAAAVKSSWTSAARDARDLVRGDADADAGAADDEPARAGIARRRGVPTSRAVARVVDRRPRRSCRRRRPHRRARLSTAIIAA